MAIGYQSQNLRRIAHGGNVATVGTRPASIWSFVTADAASDLEGASYLNSAYADGLQAGDVIWAILGVGGTLQTKEYIVLTSTSTGVTLQSEQAGGQGATIAARLARTTLEFSMNLADITAADLITNYIPGYNGKILATHAFATKPATTAAKAATLTPKVNATPVTGGALALTSANMTPAGAKVDSAAITALNTFLPTDTIGITAASVTAFVEGSVTIIIDLQNTDLLNALT